MMFLRAIAFERSRLEMMAWRRSSRSSEGSQTNGAMDTAIAGAIMAAVSNWGVAIV